jgi:hypothetical protein
MPSARRRHVPVVERDEHQVDVRFRPDGVVRQAAAENRGQYGLVALDLVDERVERRAEGFGNGPVVHATESVPDGPAGDPAYISGLS